jgi:hypothetical protein
MSEVTFKVKPLQWGLHGSVAASTFGTSFRLELAWDADLAAIRIELRLAKGYPDPDEVLASRFADHPDAVKELLEIAEIEHLKRARTYTHSSLLERVDHGEQA